MESLIRMGSEKYEPVSTLLLRMGSYFLRGPLPLLPDPDDELCNTGMVEEGLDRVVVPAHLLFIRKKPVDGAVTIPAYVDGLLHLFTGVSFLEPLVAVADARYQVVFRGALPWMAAAQSARCCHPFIMYRRGFVDKPTPHEMPGPSSGNETTLLKMSRVTGEIRDQEGANGGPAGFQERKIRDALSQMCWM